MTALPSLVDFDPTSAGRLELGLLAQDVADVLASGKRERVRSALDTIVSLPTGLPEDSFASGALHALVDVLESFLSAVRAADLRTSRLALASQDTPRRILERLEAGVGVPAELAESLGLAKSTVSEALARLRDAGLVQVWEPPGPIDGRKEPQMLTAAGAVCVDELRAADELSAADKLRRHGSVTVEGGVREALERATRNLPEIPTHSDRSSAHVVTAAVVGALRLLDQPRWKVQETRAALAYSALLSDFGGANALQRFDEAVSGTGDAPLARNDLSSFLMLRAVAFPDEPPRSAPTRPPLVEKLFGALAFPALLVGCCMLHRDDPAILSWLRLASPRRAARSPGWAAVDGLARYWESFLETRQVAAGRGGSDSGWAELARTLEARPAGSDPAARLLRRLRFSARLNAVTLPFQRRLDEETLVLLRGSPLQDVFGVSQLDDDTLDRVLVGSPEVLFRQVAHIQALEPDAPLRQLSDAFGQGVCAVAAELDSGLDATDLFAVTQQLREVAECMAFAPTLLDAPVPTPELRAQIRAELERDLIPRAALPATARTFRPLRQRPARPAAPPVP